MSETQAAVLDAASPIVIGMPEDEYHRHPALSSTGARRILESPARFRAAQFAPEKAKEAFDLGTAVHTQVLGVGQPLVEIPDGLLASNGAISTKAAKEFVAEARAAGKVPMKSGPFRQTTGAVDSVLRNTTARALFEQDGDAEASVFASDPATGVQVRARFDKLAAIAVDLKSTSKEGGGGRLAFSKSAANLGYHVQQEHYLDVYEFAMGERLDMVFVVVELEPPYLVGTYQLDKEFRDIGRARARRAREIFAECMATSTWPGYPDEVQLIGPPRWAVIEHELEGAA
jgi:hypothetical protein